MAITHVILLGETEELPDLGSPLGTQPLRLNAIRQPRDLALALLNDAQSQHGQVHRDDAASDRLPLALTSPSWSVAAVAVGEEQPDTGRVHDTLLHREALLVVAARDLECVALPLVADRVARNLVAHATLHEHAQLALIVDLDQLLRAVGRVRYVELHLDGECGASRRRVAIC